ncbi:MAG TPA: TPM domain-containing protein [Opitutaceae bacterium]|nr:TPM domain-containing protein [Opitutaceae bacterium]
MTVSSFWRNFLCCAAFFLTASSLLRSETIPPRPSRYFNDYAGVVSATRAAQLNHKLAEYERESSNQIVVAVFPTMTSESSIEDYTVRVAQAWAVGQKDKKNGAVLFVFLKEHRMYIQVGYGLEPVLTDATCSSIINRVIKPRFRANDFGGGLSAGVDAMISASRGEYKGSGFTHGEGRKGRFSSIGSTIVFFVLFLVFSGLFGRSRQRRVWGGSRHMGGWGRSGGFGGFGGFGGGGGGGSSRSNDTFSGGGGSFGGGGAGGSW